MVADIIELDAFRNAGNGGREALLEALLQDCVTGSVSDEEAAHIREVADVILARLWLLGFKLVPLEQAHGPESPLYA